ncbi:MAG: hypothetical protein WBH50_13165 [Fuerstiella sp.]
MKLAFETDQLQVFKAKVDLGPYYDSNRTLYVAFPFDDLLVGKPMPVASALIWHSSGASHYVDWVETAEDARRQGLARELLLGIAQDLKGEMRVFGATEAGEALVNSLMDEPGDVPLRVAGHA